MTDPVQQLAEILPKVSDLVEEIHVEQLVWPTPCDEFTVHDVIDHMIVLGTQFAHLFRGEPAPETTAPPAIGRVPAAEFRAAMDDLLDAVASDGALERTLDTPIGQMPGATFAAVVAFDGLIHGWDLSVSTSRPFRPAPDVVDAVAGFARVALDQSLRDAGMFGDETAAPDDATPMEALAAFSGRTVEERWRSLSTGLSVYKDDVPVALAVPGATARQRLEFGDVTGYGTMAGEYFSLAAGTDIAPLLHGLRHDLCDAPHWGYMLHGEVVVTYADGRESTTSAGELFYWPPQHSVRVTSDADLVLFSPQHEHVSVVDHMRHQLGAA